MTFSPEPLAAAGIARQIKASGRAYGVFHTAKLFLERPERHRVSITSLDANVLLHQIGDGPVSFDSAAVERGAFAAMKAEYYSENVIQGEPIKGNFTNVARSRTTGILLAPTNHHSYQTALRKLYDERFSRRMHFQEFLSQEIEVLSNEQAVADWKEQARSKTTFTTLKEAEPVTFETLAETEAHFRKTYLPALVKSGVTLECSGQASRIGLDRHVNNAVRDAWEKERPFPQNLVNALRPYFMDVGLHFFKHRKRMLFACAHKPQRHTAGEVFSDGIASILTTVNEHPRIKRPQLAVKLLGEKHDDPEVAARKVQLAQDLHYLLVSGHVIEFADGALELPLAPKAAQASSAGSPAEAADDEEPDATLEAEASAASATEPHIEAAPPQPVGEAQDDPPAPEMQATVETPIVPEPEPLPAFTRAEIDPAPGTAAAPVGEPAPIEQN